MKTINAFYDNSEFKDAELSEPRNVVLSKSLAVEKYMSMYLAAIMDIENYLDSKSFGNTSSALSFNQKLNLFADLEYVTKEEKIKLISFSEIRNQFAHNSSCLTFGHAFNVEVTITDNFGLDKPDVMKFQNVHNGFAAWYILQHARGYVPFRTKIVIRSSIGGRL